MSAVNLRLAALPAAYTSATPSTGTGDGEKTGILGAILPPVKSEPPQGDPVLPVVKPGPAPADGPGAAEPAAPPTDPDVVTLPDGRQYRRRVDPATGHLLYEHNSTQVAPNGNRLTLSIVIDISPDGPAQKTTAQRLDLATGAFQEEKTVTSFDATFTTIGEVTDFHSKEPAKELFEHTVSEYTAGQAVRRTTDLRQLETANDPDTGESIEGENVIQGVWFNGGQPLNNAIVPTIDRKESVKYVSPGQGINKDTPRIISTYRHGTGTLQQMQWPEPMTLTVRFDGRDGQYIERELSVPLDTAGNPKFADAEVVRTDDRQKGYVKALMQARIWGGFTSQIMAVIGSRMVNGSLGTVGKMLLWGGFAAGGAEIVGEGHALYDQRNDASVARLAMGIYDTTWLGLFAYYAGRRGRSVDNQIGSTPFRQRDAGTALGAVGLAISGAKLVGDGMFAGSYDATKLELGSSQFPGLRTGTLGNSWQQLLGAGAPQLGNPGALTLPADWRAEQRFDPAAALRDQLDIAAIG